MWITDSAPTNRQRLTELAEQARRTDQEVFLEEITARKEGASGWRDVVQPFQSILYVSQEGDVEELRLLHAVCKAEKKVFLPATCLHQTGMAGPVVHPESDGCWESAWRRIHQSAVYKDPQLHVFTSTAGAMLANVIVFELFKTVTGASELRNSFFLLDLETLEGSWHPFMPHPLIHGCAAAQRVPVSNLRLDVSPDKSASNRLMLYFDRLTSAQTGILHIWEEGDLRQLPLSQCRVQAVDPLSEGPAGLLPDLVCTGLTHEEARREAGLSGIEAYVSRLAGVLIQTKEIVGIGAGETAAEGVIRGLQANLAEQLAAQQKARKQPVIRVQLSKVEDERCRFYLQALTAMKGAPMIGLGEEVSGFPVVWVGTGDNWYGSAGLNRTMALQKVLKAALHKEQNNSVCRSAQVLEASSVQLGKEVAVHLVIPSSGGTDQPGVLQEALQILHKNGKQLFVVDLAVEPFFERGARWSVWRVAARGGVPVNTVVAIIGEGELADLVCGEMSAFCRVVRLNDFKAGVPEGTDFALVLHDAWHPSVHREAEEVLRTAGIPWLRGFVAFGEGVVGPLIRPGLPGCTQCADNRRLLAGRDRKESWMLQQRLAEAGGIPCDAWASRTGLLQMAFLLVTESQKVLQGSRSRSEERMFFSYA